MMQLLDDIVVIDFSQFLSGPSAGLRLADMGAEVIKIEKPGIGDICRELYVSDVVIEGESTIFHAINRNKKSYQADLKEQFDLNKIKKLLKSADVLIHNFRPGVMEKLGLDYNTVKQLNPAIVYGAICGYGKEGPWKDLPGQDLLLQSVSGLTWLTNNRESMPTPMGVAVVDIIGGAHLAQGILAALYRRCIKNEAVLVEVNMFESILDFQFEVFTCYLNDGNQLPERSAVNNAHAYVAAPYGIYRTNNGFMALAMGNIIQLANLLSCDPLKQYTDSAEWFTKRDEIKSVLVDHLLTQATSYWLAILQPADIWCAPVFNYDELMQEEGYKVLNMEMEVKTGKGFRMKTTRCPIKIDGEYLTSPVGAPMLGEHNTEIDEQFQLIS